MKTSRLICLLNTSGSQKIHRPTTTFSWPRYRAKAYKNTIVRAKDI
jgi:hypothetical protein